MGAANMIGEGLGEWQNATLGAQITTAVQVIGVFAPALLTVNKNGMEKIALDQLNYSNAMAMSVMPDDTGEQGPHMAVKASMYNLQKDTDQREWDLQAGDLQNMVETSKSENVSQTQSLHNIFKMAGPMIDLFAKTLSIIARG